jgi:hypothetical protein
MTARRIQIIERVLGLAKGTQNDGFAMSVSFGEGYGPPRTLLEVDFDLAPGYYVYDKTRPPEDGDEPQRKNGDVWIQRFPTDTQVLSIPIYMLAEQVAQIMRFLSLPADYIVELEHAKPYNPEDYEGPYKFNEEGSWPPKGPKVKGQARHGVAFERRAEGVLSLLPEPELEDGVDRLDQRRANRVDRRPETETWPDTYDLYSARQGQQMEGVEEDDSLQRNFEADEEAEGRAPPVVMVPQAGVVTYVEEPQDRDRKRQRSPPPQTQRIAPTVANVSMLPGEYPYDPEIMAMAEGGDQFPQETVAMTWGDPLEQFGI